MVKITVKNLTFIWFITLAQEALILTFIPSWSSFPFRIRTVPKLPAGPVPNSLNESEKLKYSKLIWKNGVGNNGSRFVSDRDYFIDIVCDSWFTVLEDLFFARYYSFSTKPGPAWAIVSLNFSEKLFERLPLKGTKIAFLKIFQLGEATMCLSLTWNLWTIPRVGENIDPKSMSSSSPRFSSLHV